MSKKKNQKLVTPEILRQAIIGSFTKLNPRYMMKNPVMFVVEIGFLISLLLSFVPGLFGDTSANARIYNIIVAVILLITVLFANFAESVAAVSYTHLIALKSYIRWCDGISENWDMPDHVLSHFSEMEMTRWVIDFI